MKLKTRLGIVWFVMLILFAPVLYGTGWAYQQHCSRDDVPGVDCGRHDDGMNAVLFGFHGLGLFISVGLGLAILFLGVIRWVIYYFSDPDDPGSLCYGWDDE